MVTASSVRLAHLHALLNSRMSFLGILHLCVHVVSQVALVLVPTHEEHALLEVGPDHRELASAKGVGSPALQQQLESAEKQAADAKAELRKVIAFMYT